MTTQPLKRFFTLRTWISPLWISRLTNVGAVIALAALLLTAACTELPTGLPGGSSTCKSDRLEFPAQPADSMSTGDEFCAADSVPKVP